MCCFSSVIFIYEVYDDFYHYVFFLRAAFGYHKGEGNKGIVCYTL